MKEISLPDPSGEHAAAPSQLFTLRVWWEETEAQGREVRMQVRHVLTGETRYFRSEAALLAYVSSKLDVPTLDP